MEVFRDLGTESGIVRVATGDGGYPDPDYAGPRARGAG
jgi:hypothetical protein